MLDKMVLNFLNILFDSSDSFLKIVFCKKKQKRQTICIN